MTCNNSEFYLPPSGQRIAFKLDSCAWCHKLKFRVKVPVIKFTCAHTAIDPNPRPVFKMCTWISVDLKGTVRTSSVVSGRGYCLQTAHLESRCYGHFVRKPANPPFPENAAPIRNLFFVPVEAFTPAYCDNVIEWSVRWYSTLHDATVGIWY